MNELGLSLSELTQVELRYYMQQRESVVRLLVEVYIESMLIDQVVYGSVVPVLCQEMHYSELELNYLSQHRTERL